PSGAGDESAVDVAIPARDGGDGAAQPGGQSAAEQGGENDPQVGSTLHRGRPRSSMSAASSTSRGASSGGIGTRDPFSTRGWREWRTVWCQASPATARPATADTQPGGEPIGTARTRASSGQLIRTASRAPGRARMNKKATTSAVNPTTAAATDPPPAAPTAKAAARRKRGRRTARSGGPAAAGR